MQLSTQEPRRDLRAAGIELHLDEQGSPSGAPVGLGRGSDAARSWDPGLGGDDAQGVALCFEEAGVFDLVLRVGEGPADLAAAGFGDGAGVGGAFSGEGAFHLGERASRRKARRAMPSSAVLMGSGSARDRTPIPFSARS